MNQITLIGHTGKDPERKEAGSIVIVNCTLATNDGTKDKPKTNWHNLVVFGKTAEIFSQYVRKGSKIAVSGRIDYETYEKDGVTKNITKIVVDRLELLDNRNSEPAQQPTSQPQQTSQPYDQEDNGLPF